MRCLVLVTAAFAFSDSLFGQTPTRQNEYIAANGEPGLFASLKEMRDRAGSRFNAQNGAAANAQQQGQQPMMPFQRFFAKQESGTGFPQKAQQQPRSGFAAQQPLFPQQNQNRQAQGAQSQGFFPQFGAQPRTAQPSYPQPQMAAPQRPQNTAMTQPARLSIPQQTQPMRPIQDRRPPQMTARPQPKQIRTEQPVQMERNMPKPSVSVDQLAKASTSRESASEAVNQIPWSAIPPQVRQKVETMVSGYTFYRRLPMTGGYCNPEIYDYILCHPEVLVGIWEANGFNQISLTNDGNGHFSMRDVSGTRGEVDVLYHDNGMLIFLCNGTYEGQMSARPITGDVLCVLQYRFTEDTSNRNAPIAVTRLDAFVRMQNPSADLVGKAFAPMIGKVVDSNFVKMVDSVNQISETMEKNPKLLADTLQEAQSVSMETKQEFLAYIERVTGQASMRSQGVQVDYFLAPKKNVAKSEPAPLLSRKNGTDPNAAVVAGGIEQSGEIPPAPEMTVAKPTPKQTVSLPLPSTSKKTVAVKSEPKTSLPAVGGQEELKLDSSPVLSSSEKMEEFTLNDDSQELVFSDDSALVTEETSGSSSELSFDLEYEDESASAQEVTAAKPVPETVTPTESAAPEQSTNSENDGWNAVSPTVTVTQQSTPAEIKANSNASGSTDSQRCSWKKPDLL